MKRRTSLALLLVAVAAAPLATSPALAAGEVTVGYQLINSPWAVAIKEGRYEKETGYKINWVKFDSGAKVATAMASGDVQIGVLGSSPFTAAVSRGVDLQLFWILDDIAASEAMVARQGSGIDPKNPSSLKGKKVATPFVSTAHFHTMFALEVWGLKQNDVQVLNMQPPQAAAAWERGDIDAAFVWDPALARMKKNGDVVITSGELSARGKATFDGVAVSREFAGANKDFMAKFVRITADADAAYLQDKAKWTADSAQVKAVVELFGGEASDIPDSLSLYGYVPPEAQASKAWLGGGGEGTAVKTLQATAEFLKEQGRIDGVLPDYSKFVTAEFVEAAMRLGKQ